MREVNRGQLVQRLNKNTFEKLSKKKFLGKNIKNVFFREQRIIYSNILTYICLKQLMMRISASKIHLLK